MGKSGHAPKVVKPSKKAEVVVFDETKYGLSRLKSLGGQKFTRRKLEGDSLDNDLHLTALPDARPNSNDPDDIADMEVSQLWERLKTTVEDIAVSGMSGRDRKKHLLEKAARLSGKEIEKPKAPFKIRMGMQAAQKKREKKAKEEARERDAVLTSKPQTSSRKKGNFGRGNRRHR